MECYWCLSAGTSNSPYVQVYCPPKFIQSAVCTLQLHTSSTRSPNRCLSAGTSNTPYVQVYCPPKFIQSAVCTLPTSPPTGTPTNTPTSPPTESPTHEPTSPPTGSPTYAFSHCNSDTSQSDGPQTTILLTLYFMIMLPYVTHLCTRKVLP